VSKEKPLSANKGRVDESTLNELSDFAKSFWQQEFDTARKLFTTPEPDNPKDKDQWVRNKRAALSLLKELAQHRSGAVHPRGRNTVEEKTAAQRWLDKANAELEREAVVNVQSDDED
jgi:hypothetical protein